MRAADIAISSCFYQADGQGPLIADDTWTITRVRLYESPSDKAQSVSTTVTSSSWSAGSRYAGTIVPCTIWCFLLDIIDSLAKTQQICSVGAELKDTCTRFAQWQRR